MSAARPCLSVRRRPALVVSCAPSGHLYLTTRAQTDHSSCATTRGRTSARQCGSDRSICAFATVICSRAERRVSRGRAETAVRRGRVERRPDPCPQRVEIGSDPRGAGATVARCASLRRTSTPTICSVLFAASGMARFGTWTISRLGSARTTGRRTASSSHFCLSRSIEWTRRGRLRIWRRPIQARTP
jgi:hypothetical protein